MMLKATLLAEAALIACLSTPAIAQTEAVPEANTDTMTCDLLGRRFYVGFRTAF